MRGTWAAVLCAYSSIALGATDDARDVHLADVVLTNGKVVTLDARSSTASALVVHRDRIIFVGDDATAKRYVGAKTRHVDLRGHTAIPGLIDGHYHYLSKAVDGHLGVDVALVKSIKAMVGLIADKVAQTPPGQVVYTSSGWLPAQLAEGRTPTRRDLDPVSPNHPVVVQGGHSLYLNSFALKKLGIDRTTPSPEGGIIEKDPATGELTGRLTENAMYLARPLNYGKPTFDQKLAALRAAQPKLNSVGITGVREPQVSAENMRVYQTLRDSGDMTVRVSMNWHLDPSLPTEDLLRMIRTWGVSTGFGDEWLRLDGVGEFGIDGGFESALMSEPYTNDPGPGLPQPYYGLQRIPTDKFERVLLELNRHGWRASVHIAGDRGLDAALDAYEKANQEAPIARKRWTLEHLLYTRKDQFERIKRLGLTVSTQFHGYMAAADMTLFWGPKRAAASTRVRDWIDAGLVVGGGSDWSLLPANPFWAIYYWATRDSRLSGPIGEEQRLTREESLRVMTINNAYLTMEENLKGSLEVGKLADVVILSDDILTVPDSKIRDIEPLATMVGGTFVYVRPGNALGLN